MLAYCGRPRSASFCDRSPYICVGYAWKTIAESCSIWGALATAIITQTRSYPERGNGGKRARGNPRLVPAIALGP